jgi:tripartite ATP-independent transporter DctP family solute receptor
MSPLKPLASAESPQVRPHNSLIRVSDYAAVILAATVMGLANANARDFQATDTQPQEHPTVQAIVYMDQLVRDRTQGRHRINVFHSGTLGEQTKTFEQTRLGAIDINRTNMAPFTSFIGVANILGMPFLFRSVDHLHKVLDGQIGEDILDGLRPYGFIGLAFYEAGSRSVYTSERPVRMLEDLKGLRIRLQQSDLMINLFKAFGAESVLLPYTQTMTGLSTKLIDAAENNWPSYMTSKHYTVAPYYSLTEHTMTPDILLMSSSTWDSLSREDQQIFRQAARESSKFMRSQWEAQEERAQRQARDVGVAVIKIDKKPFEAAAAGLYDQVLLDSGLNLLLESIRMAR